MFQTSTVREPRKDAQRNRMLILHAARQAFASEGVEVSMDAIAKKAGVGPGTLYRNFPSKDALLAALLALHHAKLDEQRAVIAAEESDTGRALERWIDALGDWMLAYQGLPEPLRAACQGDSALTPTCLNVIETTEIILRAAQNDGHARRTLEGRDIFLGALAIAWARGMTAADERTRTAQGDLLKKGWSAVDVMADN
ncbi:TetR/AcrR family transcriptional regulator [Methylobacterium sp. Leaf93]|uniref:TetR/AcrR family transcriptional regulator n=1 Tax=Methylobacterium sp. Leaf93 TaxID=1736249 RepID=UPI0006F80F40|nr:TetR/AcrR family transcriptional regulator [Methylobacterium sp. Leaf93]KQP15528.1 TetR family transcriptional regulator [Methylobacterium sp. Leaf93]